MCGRSYGAHWHCFSLRRQVELGILFCAMIVIVGWSRARTILVHDELYSIHGIWRQSVVDRSELTVATHGLLYPKLYGKCGRCLPHVQANSTRSGLASPHLIALRRVSSIESLHVPSDPQEIYSQHSALPRPCQVYKVRQFGSGVFTSLLLPPLVGLLVVWLRK